MSADFEEVPHRHFSLRQRLILATAPYLASWLYRLIYATCKVEVRGREHFDELVRSDRLKLGGFWHETIGLGACALEGRDYVTLTSYSFDGELAARFARRFGTRSVRGSSSRGSVKALALLEKAITESEGVLYTLDGPRGPRRRSKPGIAYLAARTGYPVLPIAAAASKAWRLKTWDKFIIPKPGAHIIVAFGEPVQPPADDSAAAARVSAQAITDALNALHDGIETELGAAG